MSLGASFIRRQHGAEMKLRIVEFLEFDFGASEPIMLVRCGRLSDDSFRFRVLTFLSGAFRVCRLPLSERRRNR